MKHTHIMIQDLLRQVMQYEPLSLKAECRLNQVSGLIREIVTELEIVSDGLSKFKKGDAVPDPIRDVDWDYITSQAMMTYNTRKHRAALPREDNPEAHVVWATLDWLRNYQRKLLK